MSNPNLENKAKRIVSGKGSKEKIAGRGELDTAGVLES
jgi:hypothetical protein